MADGYYSEDQAEGIGLPRLQQAINLMGAAVSVALVVGLALWGYQLAVRDVTGIPVVQAMDEPMRIAPADPGGEIAGNLGLAVNAIAAEGTAVPPPDQLVLAPRPVELTDEDQPGAATLPAAAGIAPPPPVLGVADGLVVPADPVEMPTQTGLAPPADAGAVIAADTLDDPALAPAAEVTPLADTILPEEALAAEPGLEPPAEPAPPGAITRSLRPMARPTEGIVLASLDPVAEEPVAAAPVAPETIATGTRLVQLGAFDNEADAVAEWNRLIERFGDLVAGKSRIIQQAQSGGRSFVRLRAMGFADEGEARRFCSALLSEDAACIPVAQR